jgi:hypothetical protein
MAVAKDGSIRWERQWVALMSECQQLTGVQSTRKMGRNVEIGRSEYKTKQRCKESQRSLTWSRWLA